MRNKFRKDTMNLNHVNIVNNHDGKQYARYSFTYKSSTSTNDDDLQHGLTTLTYLLKLGKNDFNKYVREMIAKSVAERGLYDFLYSVPELSYVRNPYKVIMGYAEIVNGEPVFSKKSYDEMMEAIDGSFTCMEEDWVLNRQLLINIAKILAIYLGLTVDRGSILLPHNIIEKCLSKMKKDSFSLRLDNGYQYIRDILKDLLAKNK